MKKRLMSVLLALVMVIGVLPTAAFATEEKETINYVSIGDSMANGYCFVGYEQDSNDRSVYNFKTGEGMYGKDAYPEQFAAYLDEKGYDVKHTRLAPSALLAGTFCICWMAVRKLMTAGGDISPTLAPIPTRS